MTKILFFLSFLTFSDYWMIGHYLLTCLMELEETCKACQLMHNIWARKLDRKASEGGEKIAGQDREIEGLYQLILLGTLRGLRGRDLKKSLSISSKFPGLFDFKTSFSTLRSGIWPNHDARLKGFKRKRRRIKHAKCKSFSKPE